MMPIILEIVRLKKKPLLLAALLLLINIGLYAANDFYQQPEINGIRLQWNDLRRKVAVTAGMDINALYKQVKEDLNKLAERIPAKRQFPRLLGDILEIANANSVTCANITYKPKAVKDQNLSAYEISMNVSGSYAGIKSFLSDMMKIRELVVIDRFTISRNDQTTEKVTMTLNLTLFMREGS